jgi:GDP-D-mannose dehydratase
MFSGYLTGRSGDVSIEEGTEPKPEDFYGQAKAELMELSQLARQQGVYVNSPILFNHDSIFKKPGYVGSAAAKVIASRLSKLTHDSTIDLDASVDISDALLVVEAIYGMRQGYNSSPLLGSGVAMRVGTLVSEQTSFLGNILNIATDSGEYLPDSDHAVLVPASSSISRERGSVPERNSWLSVMAFSELTKNQIVTPAVIPNLLRAPLPRTFWDLNPSSIHELSPAR